MRSRFSLVIFDCDGVVVDSERVVHEVFAEFVAGLGVRLTQSEMLERFLGRTLADCLKVVAEHTGEPVPASVLDEYRARRDAVLRERVRPIPGAPEVLEQLDVPFCIASSGDHDKMRTTLGATGLLPLFAGRVFSATEVPRGKPAPDIFLHAAARMGVSPEEAVVIEDSVNGVLAGRAAGMTVLGYADLVAPQRLTAAGAQRVFTDMRELPKLLGEPFR
jgi:HAD superfamily hydrolase (TIGR01509 family)